MWFRHERMTALSHEKRRAMLNRPCLFSLVINSKVAITVCKSDFGYDCHLYNWYEKQWQTSLDRQVLNPEAALMWVQEQLEQLR